MVHFRMKWTASVSHLPPPRLGNFVAVLKRISEFTWGLPWLIDYLRTYIRLGLIVIETVVYLGTWLNTFSTDWNDYGEFVGTFNYCRILCFIDLRLGIILVSNQPDAQFFFLICLFQFSTCFEHSSAHHQENQLYQYNLWYMSLWEQVNGPKLRKIYFKMYYL